MNTKEQMTTYFGNTVSGFVANKYIVSISGFGFGNLRFHVKSVALPFETLNTVDDIYVSLTSLAKPKNIISVQTYSELRLTFNMDKDNSIMSQLIRIFNTNHSMKTLETTRSRANLTIKVEVYNGEASPIKTYTYSGCEIHALDSYDLSAADRKFKEYTATFICNGINDYYKLGEQKVGSMNQAAPQNKVTVNCSILKEKYDAAKKAYQEILRRTITEPETAGGTTTIQNNDIINKYVSAIDQSGIINAFNNIDANRDKCPNGMPLQVELYAPKGVNMKAYAEIVYGKIVPAKVKFLA